MQDDLENQSLPRFLGGCVFVWEMDICLRVVRAGYRIVYESAAVLRHYECQTRRGGVTFAERERWYRCWADEIDPIPFYSPNLTRMRETASLRWEE